MQIGFRVDASAVMGAGHVMRCIALADALALQGARVSFVCGTLVPGLDTRIEAAGHALIRVPPLPEPPPGAAWDGALVPAGAQRADALATLAPLGSVDWLVVDHYRLDREWQRSARAGGARIMVIDDLANRFHACDLLVDQTFGRRSADYEPWLAPGAVILAGSQYAVLRAEFAEWRATALARRREVGAVRNVLISLGSTDVGGISARALEAALGANVSAQVRVVLGAGAPSAARVAEFARADPRVGVIEDTRVMARLMAEADLAIGAGGVSAAERCCLGLPSVIVALADNQRGVTASLVGAGAAAAASDPDAIGAALERLASGAEERLAMTAAAAAIVDGNGIGRVMGHMIGGDAPGERDLSFRNAAESDSERLWLWRNDPDTRAASQSSAPVPWPAHEAWFARALASPDRHLLIATVGEEPIGMVRFDRQPDRSFEVSINLRPEARGGGMGRKILKGACGVFLDAHGPVRLEATIHETNAGSRRVFEDLGFRPTGNLGEGGFARYVRPEGAQ